MVGLADGRLHAVEALVRWHHPRQGLLLPGRFIAAAEETGLVVPLGRQVLADRLRRGRLLGPADPGSAAGQRQHRRRPDRATPGWSRTWSRILDATGLPPAQAAAGAAGDRGHPARGRLALTTLRALADAGIRIAVDDFGTGQANHTYLRRLPLHEIKLAAEFVTGVGGPDGDTLDQHLAASLIDLGHTLGLTVTAEGVETARPGRLAARRRLRHRAGLALLPRLPGAEVRPLLAR